MISALKEQNISARCTSTTFLFWLLQRQMQRGPVQQELREPLEV